MNDSRGYLHRVVGDYAGGDDVLELVVRRGEARRRRRRRTALLAGLMITGLMIAIASTALIRSPLNPLGARDQLRSLSVSETQRLSVGPPGQVSSLATGAERVWIGTWSADTIEQVAVVPLDLSRVAERIPAAVSGETLGGGGLIVAAGAVWSTGTRNGTAVLDRIDPASGQVSTIELREGRGIDVTASSGGIFVLVGGFGIDQSADTSVVRVDTATNEVTLSIPVKLQFPRRVFSNLGTVVAYGNRIGPSGEILAGGDFVFLATDSGAITGQVEAPGFPLVSQDDNLWLALEDADGALLGRYSIADRTVQDTFDVGAKSLSLAGAALSDSGLWLIRIAQTGEPTLIRFDIRASQIDSSTAIAEAPIAVASTRDSVYLLDYGGDLLRYVLSP